MKTILKSFIILSALVFATTVEAQSGCTFNNITEEWEAPNGGPCVNPILTAVPFLRLTVDARSGGMGEAGLAISPDASAMHFNSSKLAFSDKKRSIAINYRPWNSGSANLFYLTGYEKINDKSTVGVAYRYFSLGQLTFADSTGITNTINPREMEIKASYARQLSKSFSVGLAAKYIISDLASGQNIGGFEISTGQSFAIDASMNYINNKIRVFKKKTDFSVGLAVTNLGQKLSYTSSINTESIPTNLGLGTAWKIYATEKHSITFAFDANKLLVPTPSFIDENSNGTADYRETTTLGGIFSSFSDAPNGSKEELRELQYAMGIEYWLQEKWAFRAGYFSDHATKGNRQFFTTGIGARIKNIGFDVSIEIPKTDRNSDFGNRMRFTLIYEFTHDQAI